MTRTPAGPFRIWLLVAILFATFPLACFRDSIGGPDGDLTGEPPDPRIDELVTELGERGFVTAGEMVPPTSAHAIVVTGRDSVLVVRKGAHRRMSRAVRNADGTGSVVAAGPQDRPASSLDFLLEPSSNEDPGANNDITYQARAFCDLQPSSFRVDSIRPRPLRDTGGHEEAGSGHPAPRPVGT